MRDKLSRPVLSAAIVVAAAAFLIYRATLLPGFDFGDTPSFQIMSGEPVITPRDGYPLYFAIGRLFTLADRDRAHAMNLVSAVEGAVASGLLVVVGAELSGSVAAAAAAALLFAGSYTFWSQAIIAEVYALHACFLALTLWLLFRWEHDSTLGVIVRMESWLGSDTIGRMGFGHVIAGRRHTLIVERGISFVAFRECYRYGNAGIRDPFCSISAHYPRGRRGVRHPSDPRFPRFSRF